MVEASVMITNKLGLHLRAASAFVQLASRFKSEVFVRSGNDDMNGKSILGVMMLTAEPGSTIVLRADGPDENEALAALSKLVEDKFGED